MTLSKGGPPQPSGSGATIRSKVSIWAGIENTPCNGSQGAVLHRGKQIQYYRYPYRFSCYCFKFAYPVIDVALPIWDDSCGNGFGLMGFCENLSCAVKEAMKQCNYETIILSMHAESRIFGIFRDPFPVRMVNSRAVISTGIREIIR